MSRAAKLVLAVWGSGLFVLACRHPQTRASSPPPAPEVHVPSGCEANLTGRYRHAEAEAFVYDGVDDGGTFALTLHRTDEPPTDAGWATPVTVLTRTARGFVGATRTTAFNALHEPCPVSLPATVVACPDGGVVLKSVVQLAIDPGCQASSAEPRWETETLVLLGDAGS